MLDGVIQCDAVADSCGLLVPFMSAMYPYPHDFRPMAFASSPMVVPVWKYFRTNVSCQFGYVLSSGYRIV